MSSSNISTTQLPLATSKHMRVCHISKRSRPTHNLRLILYNNRWLCILSGVHRRQPRQTSINLRNHSSTRMRRNNSLLGGIHNTYCRHRTRGRANLPGKTSSHSEHTRNQTRYSLRGRNLHRRRRRPRPLTSRGTPTLSLKRLHQALMRRSTCSRLRSAGHRARSLSYIPPRRRRHHGLRMAQQA